MLERGRQLQLVPSYAGHAAREREPVGFYDDRDNTGGHPLRLVHYIAKHRRLLATLLMVSVVSALLVTMMQAPLYQATVQLEVLVPSARIFQDIEAVSETGDKRAFLTAREKMKSRAVARRVVSELGLAERPAFLSPPPDFAIANLFRTAFSIDLTDRPEHMPAMERETLAIDRLSDNLSVRLVANTSLLSIAYRDADPVLAAEIANQIAQSFIDQRIEQTSETSQVARRFIEEQMLLAKQRLQLSEEALVRYAKKAGITVTGEERSLIAANIETINAALAAAIQERMDYGRLVSQIEAGQGENLGEVLDSEGLQVLRGRIAELSAEYQQKLSLFKPGFPEMIQLQAQIGELLRQLDGGVAARISSIRLKHQETIAKEEGLQQKLAELEKLQSVFHDKNIQYTILQREVASNRSQYESLVAKLNDASVSSELRTASAAIVDPAIPPASPISPRLSLNLAIGLVLFLVAAAVAVCMRELLDNTFTDVRQVETVLGLPVLGVLPRIGDSDFAKTIGDPRSILSEAYRALRTSLQFSSTEGFPRILLVTSADPSEGKTTTSFKLGQDFAALGAKVLIIDGDLRNPGIHHLFGVDSVPGLSNLLTNTVPQRAFPCLFNKTGIDGLYVLTSGTLPPHPADLLASPKMADVVGNFYHRFDIIIMDAPPIIGLADAPHLSRIADATLLVVSANQVTRKSAVAALKRIRSLGSTVAGVAFTKVQRDEADGYVSRRYDGIAPIEGRVKTRPVPAMLDRVRDVAAWLVGKAKPSS